MAISVLPPTVAAMPVRPVDVAPAAGAPATHPTTTPGPVKGLAFQMYDETTATGAIVDSINGAKQVVNAEFFGISDAGKGAQLTNAMVAAAQRGVEVNVVADLTSAVALPLGSFQRFRSRIEDAGGNVILTSRKHLPAANKTPALEHVDHRKIVTVDGSTSFVGGMNFVTLSDGFHDTMVKLDGVAAARLSADQLDRWTRVGGPVTKVHVESVAQALGGADKVAKSRTDLRVVSNAPEQGRFELTDAYASMIRTAKQRLWITTPGVSDRELMVEINAAAARGVDVRMVSPGAAPLGVPIINWLTRAHLTNLLASGGKAFEIPEVLHRKVLIADDEAVISSYNITKRSREHDHELGLRSANPDFVAALEEIVSKDIGRAAAFDPAKNVGAGARLGAFLAKHVSY